MINRGHYLQLIMSRNCIARDPNLHWLSLGTRDITLSTHYIQPDRQVETIQNISIGFRSSQNVVIMGKYIQLDQIISQDLTSYLYHHGTTCTPSILTIPIFNPK